MAQIDIKLRLENSVKIVSFCLAAAIGYGILHDQVTVRVCPEYFTVAHPHIEGVTNLSWIALLWGIIATWWLGLSMGILLSVAANFGSAPICSFRALVRPIFTLLFVMSISALFAGVVGYGLAACNIITPSISLPGITERLYYPRYIADVFAHGTSYLTGCLGGITIVIQTWMKRLAQYLTAQSK